ncbi:cyclin a [Nesidiocoris tenuis]|uniref:Cyclin a n=1 Tax=Nesidiocoris tenuis TaxID=355587 RepID=A0ABN7BCZ4_9HEMI|nr:cyclin a [Nesidiocoris tenuis]
MDQLYGWYVSSYARDIHEYMKNLEMTRIPVNLSDNRSIGYRPALIDWIRGVAEKQKLPTTVVHLAVYLLDVLATNHEFSKFESFQCAHACLQIAAKNKNDQCVHEPDVNNWEDEIVEIDDSDDDDHSYTDRNGNYDKSKFRKKSFAEREISILEFFNWRVNWPTAANFAEYYKIIAVAYNDEHPDMSRRELGIHVRSSIDRFLDLTLTVDLAKYRPSMTAAACLLAARSQWLIDPVWPGIFEYWTGYKRHDLLTIAEKLVKIDEQRE